MQRTVDGEDWEARGWIRVVEFLYEKDVTTELNMARVPEEISESGYKGYETLGSRSELLQDTALSEDQAIYELKYLRDQELVDLFQPFEEHEFGVNRLTDDGFAVAHDLHRMEREEEWRRQNVHINLLLTVATGVLAATSIVQGILAYAGTPTPTQNWITLTYIVSGVMLLLLLIGRKDVRGPNLWG